MYFEDVLVLLTAKALTSHMFNHWEVNGVTVLDKTIEFNLKKATTIKAIDEVDNDLHQFVIPKNTILKSNDYLVICKSISDFKNVHPNVLNNLGDFDFGLGNAGDIACLFDNSGLLVDSVSFGSELPWPTEPNGKGSMLELRQFKIDNTKADSWKLSLVNLGTPEVKTA